jgi:hypothetical protein
MQLLRTIITHSFFILLNILSLCLPFASFLFPIDFKETSSIVFEYKSMNSLVSYIYLLLFSAGIVLIFSILVNIFYISYIINKRDTSEINSVLIFILQLAASMLVTPSLAKLYHSESFGGHITIGSASIIVYFSSLASMISMYYPETPETQSQKINCVSFFSE